jgi:outer membrane protein TolC
VSQDLEYRDLASLGIHALPDNEYWRKDRHLTGTVTNREHIASEELSLQLSDALKIAAGNSPEFQAAKEALYRAALSLDLEQDEFRSAFQAMLTGNYEADFADEGDVAFAGHSADLGLTRKFMTGVEISSSLVLDIARLLTQETGSAFGVTADAGITIPLLRGSGRKIVGEPLKQSRRNLLYEVRNFERFKRTFAVNIAQRYLDTLEQYQQTQYVEENYKRIRTASRRAKRLAEAGRLPGFQYDQAVQDELRARARWITARQRYARSLDEFKVNLGLPPDARIDMDKNELATLKTVTNRIDLTIMDPTLEGQGTRQNAAGNADEVTRAEAVPVALDSRLDLKTAAGRIMDAQRKIYVAQDRLRGELSFFGQARAGERRSSAGSVERGDARLNPAEGFIDSLLTLDLPLERTEERNSYRNAVIDFQQAVREYQRLEDRVKLQVMNALRDLIEAKETVAIQVEAVKLADKRVDSTDLLLRAGRAAVRDVLEAEEALLNAQNALTAAIVNYRTAEWRLQRDMGVLEVSERGIWEEYDPKGTIDDD